jgi:hypothetical protein
MITANFDWREWLYCYWICIIAIYPRTLELIEKLSMILT